LQTKTSSKRKCGATKLNCAAREVIPLSSTLARNFNANAVVTEASAEFKWRDCARYAGASRPTAVGRLSRKEHFDGAQNGSPR